jgi:hypothetical protein
MSFRVTEGVARCHKQRARLVESLVPWHPEIPQALELECLPIEGARMKIVPFLGETNDNNLGNV